MPALRPTTSFRYRMFAIMAGALTVVLLLSLALSLVFSPVFVIGGTDCEVHNGVQMCAGYPPTGLMLACAAAAAFVGAGAAYLSGDD